MAYLIKYLNNALAAGADADILCSRDIKSGYRVVIVCGSEYRQKMSEINAKEILRSDDVKSAQGNLFVLYCDDDAIGKSVDCAHILNAECQIYIKYDGVFTADPSETDFSHRLDKIDYDEFLQMAVCGYKAIDTDAVEMARKTSTVMHLLSYTDENSKGTYIKEVLGIGSLTVKGIIKDPDISIVTLVGVPDITGICYQIFDLIARNDIPVDTISLPAAFDGKGEISFTVSKDDRLKCERLLTANREKLGISEILYNDSVAKISVIGAALRTTKGVAAKVFRIMYENDIDLKLINTSEIKLSVFVEKSLSDIAVRNIHKEFID